MTRSPVRRDQCRVCERTNALRTNGTVGRHGQPACPGTGHPPKRYNPNDCGACMEYAIGTPGLAEAAASVGIEHGRTPGETLRIHLAAFHRAGHQLEQREVT